MGKQKNYHANIIGNKALIIKELEKVDRTGIDNLINYLEQSDFFTAPASNQYHGNYDGGLAEHSLNVFNCLKRKNIEYDLGLSSECMTITALMHDLCKINFYHKCIKNRKNEKTQKWEKYTGYGYEDSFPVGHGEKSVIMLQNFIRLTQNEIFMIRWHMGPSGLGYIESQQMSSVYNMCPGALALYTADIESSYILEEKFDY